MDKNLKEIFEANLAAMLRDTFASQKHFKINKKGIKIGSESYPGTKGELTFVYLGGQKAYYLVMAFSSVEFTSFLKVISPPYPSNKPPSSDNHFSMNTLGEDRGEFSRENGKIFIPIHEYQVIEYIEHIKKVLLEVYIPRAERFIEFSIGLIDDIVKDPGSYSYPSPLIAYTLKKNSKSLSDLKIHLGKKIIKNKEFDNRLLSDA